MRGTNKLRRLSLTIAGICLLGLIASGVLGSVPYSRAFGASLCVALALGIGAVAGLRGFQFTCWIVAAFAVAMIYPHRFQSILVPGLGEIEFRHPWLILAVVQLVMFGMGTQMRMADLVGVVKSPLPVAIGLVCQFTIMPLLGFGLARGFHLPPEIAAGVVLIGSCSSGLSSNVMVYMAKGNIALSVTLTAVATMCAPVITPLWMKLLAGELIEVKFLSMMVNIIKIVVVPIGAAFVHDLLKQAERPVKRVVYSIAVLGCGWLIALCLWQANDSLPPSSAQWLVLSGFIAGAIIFGVAYHYVVQLRPESEKVMPVVSMFGIVYFTLVTTAAGRDALLEIGLWLFLVAVLHNVLGYCCGYGLSRVLGLDSLSARTVALEVGLQNGGMASGLAGAMGKLGTVGLAPAIFSPWMNVSGSVLANYWRRSSTSWTGDATVSRL